MKADDEIEVPPMGAASLIITAGFALGGVLALVVCAVVGVVS
jgi:hypothetical protein